MEYKALTAPYLVEKCINKDPLAWAEFVSRFERLIFFSIKKSMSRYFGTDNPNLKDMNDIKQNILTEIWSKSMLLQIKNRKNIAYWISVVSRNITINFLKSNKKEMLVDNMSFFDEIPAEYDARDNEQNNYSAMEDAFGSLNDREKIVFRLYFSQGLKLKEIALFLRIPLGTVSSYISRIRKKIRSKS